MQKKSSFILRFDEVDKTDICLVGGKGAKLCEMTQAGFCVPNGFIVSSNAYFTFIRENNLAHKIKNLLSTAHFERADSLMQISAHIKKLIMRGGMPEVLVKDIFFAYRKLSGIFRDVWVGVSSSFGGYQENYLGVKGEANLILKIKEGWACLFDPGMMIYRHEKKIDHFQIGMAIVVQRIVESDRSGVIFTIDPVTEDKTKIVIEAIYGLGEMFEKGHVTPDRIEVRKADLEVINKSISIQTVLLKKAGRTNKEVRIPGHLSGRQKLTRNQIIDLSMSGKKLEKYYYFPQEIEWAIEKNKIYIIQSRNIATSHRKKVEQLTPSEKLQLVLKGTPASPGIVTGPVRVIHNAWDINKIKPGEVIVSGQTNFNYLKGIRKAAAVITDQGGGASHGAIVSRDLGIPAVVGTQTATHTLKDGMIVTVNGLIGEIYKGTCATRGDFKTATRVYLNLSKNVIFSKIGHENVDGVGLLQGELMMMNTGVHPKKLPEEGDRDVYTSRLSEQISFLCKEFAPRPVVYRLSDFSANEFRQLEDGGGFEVIESNQMLGYRGSFRHIQDPEVFKLEIEAIKKVRHKMGYKNLWMIVPFCRTIKELIEIKRLMTLSGLHRSPTFKLWMMAEVPSNVILLDKFIEAGIDGVSIGLDNLTKLLLGIDRDNSEVSRAFDSRSPAVLCALEQIIKTCHKHGISSSICGRDVSLYPDLIEKLVEWGISSVTVTPDVTESVRENIFDVERRLIEKRHHGKN